MELGLTGKTVIVTGGSSNIGRGIVLAFAAEGCNVVVADWDEVGGQETLKLARAGGGKVIFVQTDVTDAAQCQAMAAATRREFGPPLVLVNNAGGNGGAKMFFADRPREFDHKEMDICYWGTSNCTAAVLEDMIAQGAGRIVNMSSVLALIGAAKSVNYSAAKAAIMGFTKGLAHEIGSHGITINAVCPGAIFPASLADAGEKSAFRDPNFIPWQSDAVQNAAIQRCALGRIGRAEDVAHAVVFLASDAASYITGHTITVDGGWTMI